MRDNFTQSSLDRLYIIQKSSWRMINDVKDGGELNPLAVIGVAKKMREVTERLLVEALEARAKQKEES